MKSSYTNKQLPFTVLAAEVHASLVHYESLQAPLEMTLLK